MSHTHILHETKWEQCIFEAGRDQQLIRCLMKTSCQWREVGPSKAYQINRRLCCFNCNDLFQCVLLCVWDVCMVLTLRRLSSAPWMKINHLEYDRGGQTMSFRGLNLVFHCLPRYVFCKLSLGNSPASGVYMPTFRNTLFHLHRQVLTSTCLWRWNRQKVPKLRHINSKRRGITQKKAYNIHKTAKAWNQEYVFFSIIKWDFNNLVNRSLHYYVYEAKSYRYHLSLVKKVMSEVECVYSLSSRLMASAEFLIFW